MATKKKQVNKDIKFSQIKKSAKTSHQKEKYELEDGSTITFYPTFPQTLIEEMLTEIQTIFQNKDEEIEMSDELTYKYFLFMMIKYFTHLKSQLKADTLLGQLNEMESIIDHEVDNGDGKISLFSLITEEIFSLTEIYKVNDRLAKIGGAFMFSMNMEQKMQDEFAKLELKNRDIFENIAKNSKSENNIVQ